MNDARVQGSVESEIERAYREDGRRLWRAVYAWSGDAEVASDAVAEAFTQALARGSAIRSPLPWIWRAAFRIAAGDLKERRRRGSRVPERAYEMAEPAEELMAALRRLSPKQRAAVILTLYAGYRPAEAARIVGSTAGAVRVHLSVGRRRLREMLEDER